jgi:hypothetical protein
MADANCEGERRQRGDGTGLGRNPWECDAREWNGTSEAATGRDGSREWGRRRLGLLAIARDAAEVGEGRTVAGPEGDEVHRPDERQEGVAGVAEVHVEGVERELQALRRPE